MLPAHVGPAEVLEFSQFQIVPGSFTSSNWSAIRIEPTCKLEMLPIAGVVEPQFAIVMLVAPWEYPPVQSQTFPSPPFTNWQAPSTAMADPKQPAPLPVKTRKVESAPEPRSTT